MEAKTWLTILIVCGKNLDPDLVTQKLNCKPTAFVRAGEIPVPKLEEGSLRQYDERLEWDCWKRIASAKQVQHPLEKQLEFWCDRLTLVVKGIRELKELGCWIVIDCMGDRGWAEERYLQFRLDSKLLSRLAKLGIDIDIAAR